MTVEAFAHARPRRRPFQTAGGWWKPLRMRGCGARRGARMVRSGARKAKMDSTVAVARRRNKSGAGGRESKVFVHGGGVSAAFSFAILPPSLWKGGGRMCRPWRRPGVEGGREAMLEAPPFVSSSSLPASMPCRDQEEWGRGCLPSPHLHHPRNPLPPRTASALAGASLLQPPSWLLCLPPSTSSAWLGCTASPGHSSSPSACTARGLAGETLATKKASGEPPQREMHWGGLCREATCSKSFPWEEVFAMHPLGVVFALHLFGA